jgi:hypothetical protein
MLVVGTCLESQSQLHHIDSMSVVCSCQVRLFVWCSESLAGSAEGELLQACKAKQGLQRQGLDVQGRSIDNGQPLRYQVAYVRGERWYWRTEKIRGRRARVQRDWGFGGSTGVKSQWSVAGREAPGRPGGFVSSCLPLASNGSSLEQARFRMVDWLMSCGVRINGRGSNGGWVSGSLNQHLLSPPMGEALARVGAVM